MPEELRDRRRTFERHVQTFLLALVTAGAGIMLKMGVDAASHIEAVSVKVDNTSLLVAQMYRASDAARDMADVAKRVDGVEKRIDANEKNIGVLDRRLRYVEEHPTTQVRHP